MDQSDQTWFNQTARQLCPKLTPIEYERIIDQLENASTRTLVSLDEARTLFASSEAQSINDEHIAKVYQFWHERRTTRVLRAALFVSPSRKVSHVDLLRINA